MQIQITGQQIDLGSSLRSYIESALEGTISKYFEDAVKADVRIFKERNEAVAEITVHPVSGVLVRATGASGDPYAAFDTATNKVARQLRRYKNKDGLSSRTGEMVAAAVIESDEEKEVVGDAPVIRGRNASRIAGVHGQCRCVEKWFGRIAGFDVPQHGAWRIEYGLSPQ